MLLSLLNMTPEMFNLLKPKQQAYWAKARDVNLMALDDDDFLRSIKSIDVSNCPRVANRMKTRVDEIIDSLKARIKNGKIEGSVNISRCFLTKLPDILGGIEITGSFDCSNNQLTSLVGAPSTVSGDFDCGDNQLTSLEGAPRTVGRDFSCSRNQLTSLVGAPSTVSGDFYCSHNPVEFTDKMIKDAMAKSTRKTESLVDKLLN